MTQSTQWVPNTEQFWQASLALYQQPGAQARLLEAQDKQGLNVNLELLRMYLASQQASLTEAEYQALEQAVQAFSRAHTQPLRELRKTLSASGELDQKSRQQLKSQLLAAELTLEAQEQAVLLQVLTRLRSTP